MLSSTLNFWIEYLSCNDDLVSKISDHFPNVNYLKSPKLVKGLDFIIAILINAEINNQHLYSIKLVNMSNFTRR